MFDGDASYTAKDATVVKIAGTSCLAPYPVGGGYGFDLPNVSNGRSTAMTRMPNNESWVHDSHDAVSTDGSLGRAIKLPLEGAVECRF